MINSGSIIGNRYEIISEIGRGGMAKVYKAKDIRLKRNVAIKILNEEYSNDKKFVRKFIDEARAAAGISHQNIVNVFDVGEEDNLHYIVMELVEGITLKKYINNVGAISSDDTCRIAIQIAYGIEAAHNNHIIHRDIKPQNIVISDDGYAKVADFGIAKAANGETINNAVAGSVHYMAPEQARSGYSDEKSDIYSLGITMYEMVTGRLPFDSENNVSVVWSHINTPIIPPSEYKHNISPGLEQIILRATNKRSTERYQNITDMIRDLKYVFKNPGEPLPYDMYDSYSDTIYMDRDQMNLGNDYDDNYVYEEPQDDSYYYDENYNESEGEVVNPNIKKIMNILTIVGGSIIALLLLFLIIKFGFSPKSSVTDKVPNIIGMTLKEARQVAEATKFNIEIVEFDKNAPEDKKDQIIKQDPEAGSSWNSKDKVIKITIAGSDEVKLNDYSGRPKDEAIRELEELGLSVTVEEAFDNDKEEGIVIKTNPLAGSSIAKNTKVTLYVSKGAETVTMVNVNGLSQGDAEAKLRSLGINFTIDTDNGEKGVVVRTSPAAGAKFKKSQSVTVYIGNGKKAVAIPDLTGETLSYATKELNKLGLQIEAVQEKSDSVPAGKVIRTEPAAGTKVAEGDVIKVFVSGSGTMVPDVRGMARQDAVNLLYSAGFKVKSVSGTSSSIEKDAVIEQSPPAGSSAEKGSTVYITVNR